MPRSLHLNGPSGDDDEPVYMITVDRSTGPQAVRLVVSAGSLHIYAGSEKLRIDLPEPDESDVEAAFERAVAALPEKVELVYVDRDDQLSDEQIQKAFNGEAPYDDADFDEFESDARFNGAWSVIEGYVDSDDLDILKQTEDQVDELRFKIEERDESDAFRDLARNTPNKLMRYAIGVEASSDWTATDEDILADAGNIAGALGIDLDEHRETLVNLVREGQGGVVYVYWYGDVADMIEACQRYDANGGVVPQTITWDKPALLVLNGMEGSGYEVTFPGSVTLPFDRDNLKLDARGIGNGYSWDEVAAVSASGYGCKVTITKNTNEPSEG